VKKSFGMCCFLAVESVSVTEDTEKKTLTSESFPNVASSELTQAADTGDLETIGLLSLLKSSERFLQIHNIYCRLLGAHLARKTFLSLGRPRLLPDVSVRTWRDDGMAIGTYQTFCIFSLWGFLCFFLFLFSDENVSMAVHVGHGKI